MGSFTEELWETIWTGWTPVLMVGLLFLGLTMAKKFASLGVTPLTVVLAYFLGCTLVPLSLPLFIMYIKNRR